MTRRIDPDTLREMGAALAAADRDEMAIPSYLHKNPALRWMAWRRVEVTGGLLRAAVPQGGTVLDYGCGTGVLFEDACERAARVVGVDLVLEPARLLVERRGLSKVELMSPEGVRGALGPGSVDVIVAAEVLEHIEDLDECFAFFARVLKPGGQLLVSLPTENAAYRFGRKLAGFTGDYHSHDAAGIDAHLVRSGFRPTKRKAVPLPGPAMIYLVAAYSPPG